MPKRPSRPRQNGVAREGADDGGAGRGAGGSGFRWDIPPRSAPGGCEAAQAKRWTSGVTDALSDAFLRICGAAVSAGRILKCSTCRSPAIMRLDAAFRSESVCVYVDFTIGVSIGFLCVCHA